MALNVEIHQKENVRPFSPTPHSLRNYKLSQIDQIEGTHYTSMLFFYNTGGAAHHHDYDALKQSLSKTLSVFYPVAGRVKDGMTIECNDEGVDFVTANVTNYDLSDFVRVCKVDDLRQLLPFDPYPMEFDPSQPMLGVQVNKFRCGGTAVAICVWHGVADAAAIGGFVQTWSAINRGEGGGGGGGDDLVVDATAIFPPALNFDFSAPTSAAARLIKTSGGKYSKKRFVFRKEEIERMRDEYTLPDRRRPTSVEALSAFIWAAVIRANQNAKMHILIHVTDLRKRLNPPFPSMCLGNFVYVTGARWMADGAGGVTPQSLVGNIREAIIKVTGEYVRKIETQGGLTTEIEKIAAFGVDEIKVFGISSICGFPFHELDFGWGKPIWFVLVPFNLMDGANFYKTGDGGIEAMIGLTPQVMSSLDKDKEFLARVSCIQTMSSLLST
ncbi:PREDICTED: salutaridinol 7-O-acetyltransferase-like [Ipomoea nil]|uniref:salutaridinol 7-O-acetyltransferase-like n=1 Tax=Ipomoea nil TaxID=35883 RepID=UPI000901AF41|nr:PREDICTED: salutaridinol 7-O-acetyltransferase-like [Ipomoea nil]